MNAELSRKRKLSVTHEDAQSSRGPQKGDSFNVCAPPKVRKLGDDSKVSMALYTHFLTFFAIFYCNLFKKRVEF